MNEIPVSVTMGELGLVIVKLSKDCPVCEIVSGKNSLLMVGAEAPATREICAVTVCWSTMASAEPAPAAAPAL